jgi:hypothetical protein
MYFGELFSIINPVLQSIITSGIASTGVASTQGPVGHDLEHDVWDSFCVGGEEEEEAQLVQVSGKVIMGDPAR